MAALPGWDQMYANASAVYGPVATAAAILLPVIILWQYVHADYCAFLALGPGGTPSTPRGYLRICVLRLFALRDPFEPPSLPQFLHPQHGHLRDLPWRSGPRPRVLGIAPQRQVSQQSGSALYDALAAAIRQLVQAHPERLYLGTSCFEKHSTGIFSDPAFRIRPTCNGEVCHAHPSDGSLHLTLHPADVKLVIERGWGQRHPLARESWWWRAKIVPPGFVMIYAPRNERELRCVLEIIRAAAWWVSGTELSCRDSQQAPVTGRDLEGDKLLSSPRVTHCEYHPQHRC